MNAMTAYVMVGCQGSGKTFQAQKIAEVENAVIISGDDIRAELYGDASIQGNWVEIHDRIAEQVANAASLGRNVVLDGTHYRKSYRSEAIALLKSFGYGNIEAVVVDKPLAVCLSQNFSRSRKVPEWVVTQTHERFKSSTRNILDEEFDRVTFVY